MPDREKRRRFSVVRTLVPSHSASLSQKFFEKARTTKDVGRIADRGEEKCPQPEPRIADRGEE